MTEILKMVGERSVDPSTGRSRNENNMTVERMVEVHLA